VINGENFFGKVVQEWSEDESGKKNTMKNEERKWMSIEI
jgi:hypothetical protein